MRRGRLGFGLPTFILKRLWDNAHGSDHGNPLMILQTNSYIVPREKRSEHARLLARFRKSLAKLGCDHFEAYEQVGPNWNTAETPGRFVQIMRFRDRKHQQQVQAAERSDPTAQQLIKEFCELINFPYQQQQGLFVVGFYNSVLASGPGQLPGEMIDVTAGEGAVGVPDCTPAETPETSDTTEAPATDDLAGVSGEPGDAPSDESRA
jgi:hypothetical protein